MDQFLAEHPRCYMCGGKAAEEDHIPSRACFDNREWPEGFSFPVCRACNGATSQDELFIAMFSRTHAADDAPARHAEIRKYMSGVSNNNPDLFKAMLVRVVEEGTHETLVEVGPEVRDCFRRVLPKWARAFHYLETKEILPTNQRIFGDYFTVADVQQKRVPAELLYLPTRPVTRNRKDLSSQFGFLRSEPGPEGQRLYAVLFRRAFGAWMVIDAKNSIPLDDESRFTLISGLV